MDKWTGIGAALAMGGAFAFGAAAGDSKPLETDESDHLVVVWSSGDIEVAENLVFMYALNAKKHGWFKHVTLVVWGPSSRMLAGDKHLQAELEPMKDAGVELQACVVCAERYGVQATLKELGCEVRGMGKPLSDYLKAGRKVVTF